MVRDDLSWSVVRGHGPRKSKMVQYGLWSEADLPMKNSYAHKWKKYMLHDPPHAITIKYFGIFNQIVQIFPSGHLDCLF